MGRRPAQIARALGVAVLAILGLALAGEVVRRTMAHRYAEADPALSLAWERRDPEAGEDVANRLTARALASRSPQNLRRAEQAASDLLRAAPLSVAALRDLGLIARARGDQARASAILVQAEKRGYRDVATQAWLLQKALARQDLPAALPRIDAILRVNPEMEPRLFPALFALLRVPEAPPLIARQLAARPPWRDGFLLYLAHDSPGTGPAVDLFQRLDALGSSADDTAEGALFYRLAAEGRFADARTTWLSRLPRGAKPGFPYDGDFRGLPGPQPFNWAFHQPIGERLRLERADDGRPVLAIDVPMTRPQVIAEQLGMLEPGAWRISADVRIRSPASGASVTLTISCAGAASPLANLRADASAARPWTRFSERVSVPAGCPAQWMILATSPGDGFGQISADITHVALTPATQAR